MPLEFKTTLDNSQFQRGLRAMLGSANVTASAVTRSFSGIQKVIGAIGAGAAASFAAYKFADAVKGAMDTGKAMSILGKQVGMTAGQARIFERQLDAVGSSGDDFMQAVGSLAQELAEGGKKFQALGLNVEDLKRLDPADLFRITGKAIGSIQDPLKRAAVTMDLLGEDAVKMTAAFTDPNFGRGAGAMAVQAAMLDRNAAHFASAAASMKNAGLQLENFSLAAAGPIAEGITKALGKVADGDIAAAGDQIGKKLGAAISGGMDAILRMKKFADVLGNATSGLGVAGLVDNVMSGRLQQDVMASQAPTAAESPDGLMQMIAQSTASGGRKGFWKSGDPRERFSEPLDIWNSKSETQQAIDARDRMRFGDAAMDNPGFVKRFTQGSPQDLLSATSSPNMSDAYATGGSKTSPESYKTNPSAHHQVRSRTRAEREAGLPAGGGGNGKKTESVALTPETIKELAKELMSAAKETIPK